MTCPRCGGSNINVQMLTDIKTKNRGCLGWLGWLFLAVITCGLILIIPLITNSKSKTKHHKQAICQSCGHSWRV